jgi:hypothetical protein
VQLDGVSDGSGETFAEHRVRPGVFHLGIVVERAG